MDVLNLLQRAGLAVQATDGQLEVTGPPEAMTPELAGLLRTHKAELLALLADRAGAPAIQPWGEPLFPPDVLEAMRATEVRWADFTEAAAPRQTDQCPTVGDHVQALAADLRLRHPPRAAGKCCDRCGAQQHRDVPIHNGRSTRRDCAKCGRTLGFPRWYERRGEP